MVVPLALQEGFWTAYCTYFVMGFLEGPSFQTTGSMLSKSIHAKERATASSLADSGGSVGRLLALGGGGWRAARDWQTRCLGPEDVLAHIVFVAHLCSVLCACQCRLRLRQVLGVPAATAAFYMMCPQVLEICKTLQVFKPLLRTLRTGLSGAKNAFLRQSTAHFLGA
ncbi:unnamed protein product [Symbiodinium pilosum]|uniref:Uncharacterized protein n=1 Tax=Symbiodinium pilosum TaxID=2952 RepID=A0A812R056_SYMPI|nr:unnamed protein product [Symbiodinium pilosum]